MVIDANEKIARNTDCPHKRRDAITESLATQKPITYRVGHYEFTVDARISPYSPVTTEKIHDNQ